MAMNTTLITLIALVPLVPAGRLIGSAERHART
jgi:hypothetical protein